MMRGAAYLLDLVVRFGYAVPDNFYRPLWIGLRYNVDHGLSLALPDSGSGHPYQPSEARYDLGHSERMTHPFLGG